MDTVTVVIQDPPYREGDKAWNALRFAGAALGDGLQVKVFLLGEGVDLGRRGRRVPEGKVSLEQLLGELMDAGLEVRVCGTCLSQYGLSEGDLMEGVSRGSMKLLAAWVKESGNVMTF